MAHTPNGLERSLSAPDLPHCGLKRSLSAPDLLHSSATMSNLLSLPADALLAVLSFLSPRELFSCRVVCRHLRDLCLHRLLWKRLAVDTAGTLRAALALAPCLGRICQNATDMRSLALLVLNSTCVVTVLELLIGDREDAAFATSIILKLSALGGLRALHLEVACDYSKTFTGVLLQAIYNLNGLEFLDFDNDFGGQVPAPVCVGEVRPSLSALEYKSVATDAFLEALLRTHAASLTEVALYSITAGTYMSCLAGIRGLRSLTCIANNEMNFLVYLPSLEAVDLLGYVSLFGQDNAPPGVLQFLREAAHLRRVEFIFPSQDPAAPLLSLAESRSAGALESVRVTGSAEQSVLELVAPVLCKFPSMKSLSVACVPPDVFFQAVSPASMPCLTALEVCVPAETCYHAWLHYPAVQDLLIRNPQLHLAVHGDWSSKDCACPWCRWGCHAELKGTDEFVFSAHTRMVCCPMNCLQVVSLFPLSDSEKTVSGPSLLP